MPICFQFLNSQAKCYTYVGELVSLTKFLVCATWLLLNVLDIVKFDQLNIFEYSLLEIF